MYKSLPYHSVYDHMIQLHVSTLFTQILVVRGLHKGQGVKIPTHSEVIVDGKKRNVVKRPCQSIQELVRSHAESLAHTSEVSVDIIESDLMGAYQEAIRIS